MRRNAKVQEFLKKYKINNTISIEVDHANGEQQGMPVEGVARVFSSPRKSSSRKQKKRSKRHADEDHAAVSVVG